MILRARFRHVSKDQRGKLLNPWSEAATRPAAEDTASDKFTSSPAPGPSHLSSVLLADGLAAQGRPSRSGRLVGDAIYGINDALGSIFGIVSGVSFLLHQDGVDALAV